MSAYTPEGKLKTPCSLCSSDSPHTENSKFCRNLQSEALMEARAFVQWCQSFAENTREAGSLRAKLRELSPALAKVVT
jgi:hypothetical protein